MSPPSGNVPDRQEILSDDPVTPKPAASIIVTRQGMRGPEVLMMRRHKGTAFAPGAVVYPGGKLHPADRAESLKPQFAEPIPVDNLNPMRVAAIREAFEETGLLLALDETGDWVSPKRQIRLAGELRAAVEAEPPRFGDMLRRERLKLPLNALHFYAHWETPQPLPRRFDTHFFCVAAPPGQQIAADGREAVSAAWVKPSEILAENAEGSPFLMLPTRLTLARIAASLDGNGMADEPAAAIMKITPRVVVIDGDIFVEIPEQAGYGVTRVPRADMAEHLAGMLPD